MTANVESCPKLGAQQPTRAQIIATLNDEFRRGKAPGRLFITPGAIRCAGQRAGELLAAVRSFDAFTHDNDPHEEHDFGVVELGGARYFWKIDYYDRALEGGSPDPTDPSKTTRVMTILLDREY